MDWKVVYLSPTMAERRKSKVTEKPDLDQSSLIAMSQFAGGGSYSFQAIGVGNAPSDGRLVQLLYVWRAVLPY